MNCLINVELDFLGYIRFKDIRPILILIRSTNCENSRLINDMIRQIKYNFAESWQIDQQKTFFEQFVTEDSDRASVIKY